MECDQLGKGGSELCSSSEVGLKSFCKKVSYRKVRNVNAKIATLRALRFFVLLALVDTL